jgi:hypothetical protein
MKPIGMIATIAVLAAMMGGCKSTEEYQRLAKAGNDYTVGMDKLLTAAGDIRLDATSEQLLKGKINNFDQYQQLSAVDQQRLDILEDLRAHNRLLARYFILLNELATSDAPQQAQQEVGSLVNNLNSIGNKLRDRDLVPNKDAFQIGANLIVSSQIRGALGEELQQRQALIRREFLTQKVLLKALGDSIKQDMILIRNSREQRVVILPLIKGDVASGGDQWIASRRAIMTMSTIVGEFEDATDAADRFGETFDDFVSGKLNRERLNTLLTDVESFLTFAEHLKHPTGEN